MSNMKAPFYLYRWDGIGKWDRHSGPWCNQALLEAAMASAKTGYPTRRFRACGSTDEYLTNDGVPAPRTWYYDPPLHFVVPDKASLYRTPADE